MKKIKQMQDKRDELIEQIKNISLNENLSKKNIINELNLLKGDLYKINVELKNETTYNHVSNEENLLEDLESSLRTYEKDDSNVVEEVDKKYYQSMSITYIDDNGLISEIYRINEEIVKKEIFEEWSNEYFTVTREKNKQKFEAKIKKEINQLEKKIIEKKNLLDQKYQNSESSEKTSSHNKELNGYSNWDITPRKGYDVLAGYEGLKSKFYK